MRTAIPLQRLRWSLLTLGLVLAVRQWVWMPALIIGESMEPTLRQGQLVGVNKFAYLVGTPRRGEIVEVRTSKGPVCKRIVGLPGETVALHEGIFYVNGSPLTESYAQFQGIGEIAPGQLGPGHFVVAGDNRSRTIVAVINRDRIVGRVLCKQCALQAGVN